MINRRNIRVKVMQTLYAVDSLQNSITANEPLSILNKKIEQSKNLVAYVLHFITQIGLYAEKDAVQKANKHLPTKEDLNVNTKIAGNELLWKFIEAKGLKELVKNNNLDKLVDAELLKKIYQNLIQSPEYKEYINQQSRDKSGEKQIVEFIIEKELLNNEDFITHVEEKFINWDDDADMVVQLLHNFIEKPTHINFSLFIDDEKKQFAINLLQTVLDKEEHTKELIKPKLKNWDADRIAALDMIILQMGICEFLYFETIPTKVTINEYIDLAKEYSTPQSGQFVNGLLDNLHKELLSQDKIVKKDFKKIKK